MQRHQLWLGLLALVGASACAQHGDTFEPTTIEDEVAQLELEEESRIAQSRTVQATVDPDSIASSQVSWRPKRRCDGTPAGEATPIEPDEGQDRGTLRVRTSKGIVELPLQESTFETLVVGTIAETNLSQVFTNPFDEPIEAVYVFPLHEQAAVDDYWIHVGGRSLHGEMKRREEAREIYEKAKSEGRRTGLLEQERPNIFTQSVANIMPGEAIEVQMHVVQPLEMEAGRHTLVLPTVVGPRFIPGTPKAKSGRRGRVADTDQVPDASRITPPVVLDGLGGCMPLQISVDIESGMALSNVRSKLHDVSLTEAGGVSTIELAHGKTIPNRDFELSWTLSGAEPQASLMVQPTDDGGYFTLTIQPPESIEPTKAVPRDLVFVVDNSGSMGGIPIQTAKAAVRQAIRRMNPDDRFQIIRFSESASGLSNAPLANTAANRRRGLDYIDAMHGSGGTMMSEGIKAALGQPSEAGRMPMVLLLTDGYIGNEHAIFQLISEDLGDARLFSLGVGSSVNRHLLDGMAKVGRGAVTTMAAGEEPKEVVERFYGRIDNPVLADVSIDWGELPVQDVAPMVIPDLFVGQPVVVFGRFEGELSGTAVVHGRLGDRDVELPVEIDVADATDMSGLSSMWARTRIEELLRSPAIYSMEGDEVEQQRKAAVELALTHRVMTEYTSFVAVDTHVVNPDGNPSTVEVPVELPLGVSADGVGGLGLVGTGRGGGGTGEGTIGLGNTGMIGKGGGGGTGTGYGRGSGGSFGGRGKRVPRVRQGKAVVMGSIDKDVIRRIIRAHITEVRHCYNQGLAKDPNLAGRVSVRFIIGSDGKVSASEVADSTIKDESVAKCVAKAVEGWKFPKSPGGNVTITYPFVFTPG